MKEGGKKKPLLKNMENLVNWLNEELKSNCLNPNFDVNLAQPVGHANCIGVI